MFNVRKNTQRASNQGLNGHELRCFNSDCGLCWHQQVMVSIKDLRSRLNSPIVKTIWQWWTNIVPSGRENPRAHHAPVVGLKGELFENLSILRPYDLVVGLLVAGKLRSAPPSQLTTIARSHYKSLQSHSSSWIVAAGLKQKRYYPKSQARRCLPGVVTDRAPHLSHS